MGLTLSYSLFLSSILLFSLFHLSFESSSSIHPWCHTDERSALLQFKESFIANLSTCFVPYAYPYRVASWTPQGENSSCCSWDGVHCDEGTGHVIGLNLSNSCLYGSINSSSSLFRLVHLQVLDLSYNHFNYSHIPSTIGNLSMLTQLNLYNSFFVGQIPSGISQLNKLSFLDLSLPGLELKKPNLRSLIQNLTNLEELGLSMVDISSPIPNQLANMSSLTCLVLISCGLVGKLPIGILQLPNLQFLELYNNLDLVGYFPESHLSSHLKHLCIGRTRFSGEITASIGNLVSLEYLDFTYCNLSGLVPPSLSNLSMLTNLYLSGNHFWGQLPFSFSNLTKLTDLGIVYLNLSSASCSWLSELNKITWLFLGGNNLTGDIPHFLANFTQLTYLYLGSNLFTGSMPFWVMNLTKLNYLDLSKNMLQGSIPSSLST